MAKSAKKAYMVALVGNALDEDNTRKHYTIRGHIVCRTAFLQVYDIPKSTLNSQLNKIRGMLNGSYNPLPT